MRKKSQVVKKNACGALNGGKKPKTRVVKTEAVVKTDIRPECQIPVNGRNQFFPTLQKGTRILVHTDENTHGVWRTVCPLHAQNKLRQVQLNKIEFTA